MRAKSYADQLEEELRSQRWLTDMLVEQKHSHDEMVKSAHRFRNIMFVLTCISLGAFVYQTWFG